MTPVLVITRQLETGEVREKIIDHDDPEARQWLGRHAYWAMRDGFSEVTTRPVEIHDDDMEDDDDHA